MAYILETHSVNGAVYESGPYASEAAARDAAGKPEGARSARVQWFTRDGDRRVSRSVPGKRVRHHWEAVAPEAEDSRQAAITAHGGHPFTYGLYPDDGNRCITCKATRLHSVHDGQPPQFKR